MAWIRVDSNRRGNPKMRKVGAWGYVVIEALWEIAKEYSEDGLVFAEYFDADHIGEWTRFDREDNWEHYRECISGAMVKLLDCGLIHEFDSRTYQIHDWGEYQFKTSAERTRKYRERMKARDVTVTSRDVTRCHGDNVTPNRTEQNTTLHNITEQESVTRKNKSIDDYPIQAVEIAATWYSVVAPSRELDTKWIDAVDKLHRLDGHSWDDIAAVCGWIPTDTGDGGKWPGWAATCRSPMKLRKENKSNPGESNFVVIQRQMKSAHAGNRQRLNTDSSDPAWHDFSSWEEAVK